MTLTNIIILYYGIGTPLFILLMFMISYSSKDKERPSPNTYGDLPSDYVYPPLKDKAACVVAASHLSNHLHTMNDVGIDGTEEDLRKMLSPKK